MKRHLFVLLLVLASCALHNQKVYALIETAWFADQVSTDVRQIYVTTEECESMAAFLNQRNVFQLGHSSYQCENAELSVKWIHSNDR